jgi:hypothetical protein
MLPVANTAGMIEHLSLISQATAKDRQALVIPIGDLFKPCPSRAKAGFKKSPSG